MTDPRTTTDDPSGEEVAAPPSDAERIDHLVERDLLVEEISIDGMCGVY